MRDEQRPLPIFAIPSRRGPLQPGTAGLLGLGKVTQLCHLPKLTANSQPKNVSA